MTTPRKDRTMTLGEAVRFIRSRAQRRCEHKLNWSLDDVHAVRVVTQAIHPDFWKKP